VSDIQPDSTVEGFTFYELWEIDEPFLIYATTDLSSVKLVPGTRIVSRRWAPISAPELVNSARQNSEGNVT